MPLGEHFDAGQSADDQDFRELAEWDWVVLPSGQSLHALDTFDFSMSGTEANGVTACRRKGWLTIPGPFTRMGAQRCVQCCAATGMPYGKGSPKNEDACRALAQLRIDLAVLTLAAFTPADKPLPTLNHSEAGVESTPAQPEGDAA